MREEEGLHGARESLVEVQNAPVHMDEDHVVVEEEAVEDCEGEDQEDRQVHAYEAVRLLLVVVVIEPEIVPI